MILDHGDMVLVSHRRMFEGDECRYFVGRTIAYDSGLVKLEGYSFVRDLSNGLIVKKSEERRKIVSLSSPGHFVYELPETNLDTLEFKCVDGEVILVNGTCELMNMSERAHCGHF